MPTVRLTWTDNNASETGHRVYRATSPMDVEALPTPIAELAADIVTYDDDTVTEEETYFYRVSSFDDLGEVVSAEIEVLVSDIVLVDVELMDTTGTLILPNAASSYTDDAATTLVASNGDLVAHVADASPSGNNAIAAAATPTARPNWVASEGLEFTDTRFLSTGLLVTTAFTMAVKFTIPAGLSRNSCVMGVRTGNGVGEAGIYVLNDGRLWFKKGTTSYAPAGDKRGTTGVAILTFDPSGGGLNVLKGYWNGVEVTSAAAGNAPALDRPLQLGRSSDIGQPFSGGWTWNGPAFKFLGLQRYITPQEAVDLSAYWV